MFSKTAVGLNISDHTIELVALKNKKGGFSVSSLSRIVLPDGIVERGKIVNSEELSKNLKSLFENAQPKKINFSEKIVFAIPDAISYSAIIEVENFNTKKQAKSLESEIIKSFPEDIANLAYRYRLLSTKDNVSEILVMSAQREALYGWQNFFDKNKINVETYDFESLANFRGVFGGQSNQKVCIVDVGARETSINIFGELGFEFSNISEIAGELFTKIIAEKLNLQFDSAEKNKIEFGLKNESKEVLLSLSKKIDQLTFEIRKTIEYFENKKGAKIEQVILLGGSAKIIGLLEYIEGKLNRKVVLASNFLNMDLNALEYITAIGLARRGIDSSLDKRDLKIGKISLEKKDKVDLKNILPNNVKKTTVIDKDEVKPIKEPKKSKSKTSLLLIILLLSALLLAGAFVYKFVLNQEDSEVRTLSFYENNQQLEITVPVAISQGEYTADRLRGQIFRFEIESTTAQQAEEISLERITGQIDQEITFLYPEVLYVKSIEPDDVESSNFFEITWLTFDMQEAQQLFISQLKELSNNADFIFNSIEYLDLDATSNQNVYNLTARIDIDSNDFINLSK